MAELFGTSKQSISHHIINILKERELNTNSVVKHYLTAASVGKHYDVVFYSLEMILAVGYRMNSIRTTQVRQWAQVYYDSMLYLADVLIYLLQALHPALCYVTPLVLMT